eukprot:COSAG04_NODE_176_length_21411_cov_10.599240_25_plen_142_part_00
MRGDLEPHCAKVVRAFVAVLPRLTGVQLSHSLPRATNFAHFMICHHAPLSGYHVAATAVRGALIGTAHTVRNAVILDGAASAPPPIVVRRTVAHLLRHAILLDFQCAFASDSGGAKPSKWRPATAAAFAKRWEKLCTPGTG